jgi:UDP-N-acetylglucosamine 2-epimerase (non-hydrolysing)
MAPVLRGLERRKLDYRLVFTGQHKETMIPILDEFQLSTSGTYVYEGDEIASVSKAISWLPRTLWRLINRKDQYFPNDGKPNFALVHGDTLSTLIGAIAAKLSGYIVCHVESGLRSYNFFNPFPEEVIRLLTFRLTDIAFCPGEWAYNNLFGYKLERIDTHHNTLIDAVKWATSNNSELSSDFPERYCVASIHRFENLFFKKNLDFIIQALHNISENIPVVFVLHPATEKRLTNTVHYKRLIRNKNIRLTPRMTYVPFMHLLSHAKFVITDGGSNQEELSYLGVPTILMRKATERVEGLNKSAYLSNFDEALISRLIQQFLSGRPRNTKKYDNESPSEIIIDYIQNTNF